ncbi:pyrroline-5-carboxylate reductase [Pseudomonas sp. 9.1(2019)]|uniref:pyrroline-5-carboxylate reductase n=1 Tax=Pseudomonas sp. 9.1(2019) TaxID=2580568 RepID=UPI0013687217|nr:pyrroline-5-carboxylate reductase [Pseudomonas sp. 9.1(2019)]NBG90696.1 pyrroline-5-carboxylate reductase [Pseudomonas sp. 9.1(2019)]
MSNMRIAFIGAGNMASSLIGGLLAKGLDAAQIRASDPGAETRARVSAEHGIELFADNAQAVQDADVIVIAVKPQVMKAVCQDLRAHLEPHQLLISIAAGITCTSLQNWLGNQPLVRCMPNTPALLGKGVSGLFATAAVTTEQRQQAEDLLSAVGIAVWVDTEVQIDAVTAVSGSGPAYFFLLIEAMADAGVKLGLPREVAKQLAEQTALGAAHMAVASDVDAAELRRRVTSPAGTTEAAIKSFQADGFAASVEKALSAAAHRSAEMAEQLGQ